MYNKYFASLPCSDYNRNFTAVKSAIEIAAAGPGVYKAICLLVLALILKLALTMIHVRYESTLRIIYSVPLFGSDYGPHCRHRNGAACLQLSTYLDVQRRVFNRRGLHHSRIIRDGRCCGSPRRVLLE